MLMLLLPLLVGWLAVVRDHFIHSLEKQQLAMMQTAKIEPCRLNKC
jgi:hypothetical protein